MADHCHSFRILKLAVERFEASGLSIEIDVP
jgi:hypothetical protein